MQTLNCSKLLVTQTGWLMFAKSTRLCDLFMAVRPPDRQSYRQTDRQTERQTDRQTGSRDRAMWSRFDSWTQRQMWVVFVVGSHPYSEGFSPGSPVFLPPQKPSLLHSNSIENLRATGLSVSRLLCTTLIKQSRFFFYYLCNFIEFTQGSSTKVSTEQH